jgi:UDPglucose 6-dehydrogenase
LVFGAWPLSQELMTCEKHQLYLCNKRIGERGAKIKAYDPKAINEAKEHYLKGVQNITYVILNMMF